MMKTPLSVIYIPGIGDAGGWFQPWAVKAWRRRGVEAELYSMNWADNMPWNKKFEGLLARIDQLKDEGKSVALVGVSAGATAVINAFAVRKEDIAGAVIIAGKVHSPENIGEGYRRNHPSFITSAYECPKSLESLGPEDRRRILSRFALYDETVNTRDSRIEGATNRRSPTIAHVPTIAFQITFGSPGFLRFLKREAAK